MNEQREVIYDERRRVLNGESMRTVIMKMITDIVENAVDMSISDEQGTEEWDLTELNYTAASDYSASSCRAERRSEGYEEE